MYTEYVIITFYVFVLGSIFIINYGTYTYIHTVYTVFEKVIHGSGQPYIYTCSDAQPLCSSFPLSLQHHPSVVPSDGSLCYIPSKHSLCPYFPLSLQRHPSVVPFLVYIKSEAKHVERMAVRAKYMTLVRSVCRPFSARKCRCFAPSLSLPLSLPLTSMSCT